MQITEVPDVRRADLLSALATELIFENDVPGRKRAVDALWEIFPSLPPEDCARLLQNVAAFGMVFSMDRLDLICLHLDRAVQVAKADQLRMLQMNRFMRHLQRGNRDQVDEAFHAAEQLMAKQTGRWQWLPHMLATIRCVVDGDLAAAAGARKVASGLLRTLDVPEAENYSVTMPIMIGREQRSLGTLLRYAEAMETVGSASGPPRALAAFIRFASGDLESPRRALDLVRVEEFADDAGHAVVVALWSEMASTLGSDAQRRAFMEALEMEAGVHLLAGGIYLGAADRLRALLLDRLGEHEQADTLFGNAVRQHEDLRSPTWVARTQLDWAEALLRRSSMAEARAHLEAAAGALGDLDLPDNQLRLAELRAGSAKPGVAACDLGSIDSSHE